ncbi:DUF58 domain-containing protein [Anthocerotibacter panamensis]|uniref:DUF58 domain-containing protein n=1 Tax=Anthocerotibacter panamensis TaxID=2857077 RepID=UPI001C40341F|nr:DUF58 domain-containing protein [Anthocerotibacter panamensis]
MGRSWPRVTRSGLGLLALGLSLGLLDFFVPGTGWGILLWNGLVLGLVGWDYRQTGSMALERSFAARFSLGRDNPITLTLTNPSQRTLTYELVEPIAWAVTVTPRTLRGTLEAKATLERTYTVSPTQRGTYALPPAQVHILSPLGLCWRRLEVGMAQEFIVYPDLEGLKELSVRLTQYGSLRPRNRPGVSTEFADLREYGVGDDMRFIDWKATARLGRPIVRTFQQERDQTLLILLDGGRMMLTEVEGIRKYDWALNAALALTLAGISRGDRVGLGVFDSELRILVPPGRGRSHLEAILQRVYNHDPQLVEPDYTAAIAQVLAQNPRRALVVVLTDLIDPQASAELLAALGKLAPRHLPFCVTFQDPVIAHYARTIPQTSTEIYQKAVALQLLRQRAAALRVLQSRGALVLDSPALTLSTKLVDAYLSVKQRGQL